MTKGQDHYRKNIMDDSYVAAFASTNTAMMEYPYILGHPKECSPTLSKQADTYIMDSKIGDSEVDNDDVIRRGEDVGADVVVPADVMGDPIHSTKQTVALLHSLADMEYDPTVMIPLQESDDGAWDRVDHYYMVKDSLEDYGFDISNHQLSIGGVKEAKPYKQLKTVAEIRTQIGPDQHLHGLGFGVCNDRIATFRQWPGLLDSLDMTSVVTDVVKSNKLFRPQGDRVSYSLPRGQNSTVLSAMLREFVLYLFSYMVGPHPYETDVPSEIQDDRMVEILREYGHYDGEVQSEQNSDAHA